MSTVDGGRRVPVRPNALLWVPAVLVAAAIVFEALTPPRYAATPLLAAACVVAGALLSLRWTVVFVVVSLTATVLLAVAQDRWGRVAGTAEFADVAAAGLVALVVNRLVVRQNRRLAAARNVAEEMQRVLLPPPPGRLDGLGIAARYQAAQAEARVGGDLYAVQKTPYGVRMLVADVRGKGLGAVATVSVLVGAFREAAGRAPDLLALATRLEDALDRETESARSVERRFATAILAEITPDGTRLRVVNRGHPPAYLVTHGHVRTLLPGDPDVPLGMRELAPERAPAVDLPFPAGALLVMVTDGFVEARDARGVFYDPGPGLAALPRPYDARQAVDALAAEVDRWSGGTAADDRAVLAVTRGPDPAGQPTGTLPPGG